MTPLLPQVIARPFLYAVACLASSLLGPSLIAAEAVVDDGNCKALGPQVTSILWRGAHVSEGSISVLQECKALTAIRLVDNASFDNNDLIRFAQLPQLESFAIDSCSNNTDIGVDRFLGKSRVSTLILEGGEFTSDLFKNCEDNSTVTALTFTYCKNLSDTVIARLTRFQKLARFGISFCAGISAKSADVLKLLPRLAYLDVSNSAWASDGVISGLPDCIVYLWAFSASDIKQAGMKRILGLKLKGLSISKCDAFDDEAVGSLCEKGTLEVLSISDCVNVTTSLIPKLVSLPNLEILSLDRVRPAVNKAALPDDWQHLKELKKVRLLTLAHNDWVDDGILTIVREMKSLRELTLLECANLTAEGEADVRGWGKKAQVDVYVD